MVVIGGFFTALALLPWSTGNTWDGAARLLAMVLLSVSLALRYWWVILLLDWPFRVARVFLLLAVWAEVVLAAARCGDSPGWVLALMAVSWTGAATEAYNLATGQWRHDHAPLARSLLRDHIVGLASAVLGGVALLCIACFAEPPWHPWLVLVLVVLDWGRLVEMIHRHQRLHKR
jgi:hypothetical protein